MSTPTFGFPEPENPTNEVSRDRDLPAQTQIPIDESATITDSEDDNGQHSQPHNNNNDKSLTIELILNQLTTTNKNEWMQRYVIYI